MGDLPVLEPPDEAPTGRNHIVGILLAAGHSSRFGSPNKLLATIDGEPVVTKSATTFRDASVDAIICVVGYEADRVRDVLPEDVATVEPAAGESTLSDSVAAGVTAARREGGDAVLIALGDMPWVEPTTVESLIAAYEADFGRAIAAAYEGERGNPALFDARHFDHLSSLSGDVGGRAVLRTADDAVLLETKDPGVTTDIDEPGDLEDEH
jgi:molybdenum cofactor cytidylyltransferase